MLLHSASVYSSAKSPVPLCPGLILAASRCPAAPPAVWRLSWPWQDGEQGHPSLLCDKAVLPLLCSFPRAKFPQVRPLCSTQGCLCRVPSLSPGQRLRAGLVPSAPGTGHPKGWRLKGRHPPQPVSTAGLVARGTHLLASPWSTVTALPEEGQGPALRDFTTDRFYQQLLP